MNSQRCGNCGLANFAVDSVCRRCGAALPSETAAGDARGAGKKKKGILKRVLVTPAIIFVVLLIWYASLFATSEPISFDQKQTLHRAVKVLEEKGFASEAFLLRNFVSYRVTDNWWNNSVGHADAYAATNFPFEVVTLYPDFFNVPVDDTERAMMLLHESYHLRGGGEPAAFAGVWRNKARLGWTQNVYGQTRAWRNVREFTEHYAPELFRCGIDAKTDCAQ